MSRPRGYAARAAATLLAGLLVAACQSPPTPVVNAGGPGTGGASGSTGPSDATQATGTGAPSTTGAATPAPTTSAPASSTRTPTRSSSTRTSTPVAPAGPTTTAGSGAGGYRLVQKWLPYPQQRKDEMADYARRHYGIASAHLEPQVIVVHFTESDTAAAAYNTFAADVPNRGELPGTCAHFIVDQDGTVYATVPTDLMCRHAIGLNHVAIGIEIVQATHGHTSTWAEQQILARPGQIDAVLRLIRELQARYGIGTGDVIGHAMANGHRLFVDKLGWRNDHTDWSAASIAVLRQRL
jgi:hypothetical protein